MGDGESLERARLGVLAGLEERLAGGGRSQDGAQQFEAAAKSYQVPSNMKTPVDPHTPDIKKIKLIDYDYAKYGASAERRRLISRWEKEVNALPR